VKNLLSVIVFLLAAAMAAMAATTTSTPVDIRCSGDDGLTQRVCAAIEDKFRLSTDFALDIEGKSGILIINIPTNVHWEQVGKKMKVSTRFSSQHGKTEKLRTTREPVGSTCLLNVPIRFLEMREQSNTERKGVHDKRHG
jgi:hypothetical protein